MVISAQKKKKVRGNEGKVRGWECPERRAVILGGVARVSLTQKEIVEESLKDVRKLTSQILMKRDFQARGRATPKDLR